MSFAWRVRHLAVALVVTVSVAIPAAAQTDGPASVAVLAARLSPAVVNIGTTRRLPPGRGTPFPQFPEGSPLGDLFDRLNPNRGEGEDRMREARSLGSGFFVSAEGLIVTNNHVVDGAEEIYASLNDGRQLPAEVVGSDSRTDLALLKVEAETEFAFVEFGDSDLVEVGDWVMAIGNPFGLGGSVTLGIVSARNRDINAGPYDNFIQTDAAINQGNSGGPLFDMNGRVVGINTAIIARGGTSLGIGFAVPVNTARPVFDQLSAFGETRRGWLGVGIQEVSDDIALTLERDNANGAIVVDVDPRGPSMGVLQEGDLILAFDGKEVGRMRDLPRIVAETAVGRAVEIVVLRNGAEQTFEITLGRLEQVDEVASVAPSQPADSEATSPTVTPDLRDLVGFAVTALDEETRALYGIEISQGVVISEVVEGSAAYENGFIAGLLILEVNQVPVGSASEVETLVAEAETANRGAVLFKIADPTGSSRFVALRFD